MNLYVLPKLIRRSLKQFSFSYFLFGSFLFVGLFAVSRVSADQCTYHDRTVGGDILHVKNLLYCGNFNDTEPGHCCTKDQTGQVRDGIEGRVVQAFGHCVQCVNNFRLLWCQYACDPNQKRFVDVIGNQTSGAYLTHTVMRMCPEFGKGLWDSCGDLKFGGGDIVRNLWPDWRDFIRMQGQKPYAPYSIDFDFTVSDMFDSITCKMRSINTAAKDQSLCPTALKCEDGCSCNYCTAACDKPSPTPQPAGTNGIHIFGLNLPEWEFGLIIAGIALVVIVPLSVWGYKWRQNRKRQDEWPSIVSDTSHQSSYQSITDHSVNP